MRRSWTGTHQTFDMQLDKGQEFERGGQGKDIAAEAAAPFCMQNVSAYVRLLHMTSSCYARRGFTLKLQVVSELRKALEYAHVPFF